MPKNAPYYKDKATQIAALRVTNNSHFREASSLKSFCYTFKISFKGHSSTGNVLAHNAVYLQTISLPYKTSVIYASFASLCCGQKLYEPKTKVPNVNFLPMINTIRTVLLLFSTKTKQEAPEGLQSLKVSIEQETETERFCK